MEKRNYEKAVNFEQVPEMMQAIGFYPTEQEIECMLNEIKYQNIVETGVPKTSISFEEWVKMYVNYRPNGSLLVEDVVGALKDLNVIDDEDRICVEKLTTALGEYGEVFPPQEFSETIKTLTAHHSKLSKGIEQKISLEDFITGVLGFMPVSSETA